MQGDFSIGNEARSTGGSSEVFLGSIDEVRISSIARSPSAFVFSHDADQDQLTDAWEMTHFGHLAQRAEDDYDADGTSNLVESLLQLHPASGRSMFRAEMKRTGNNLSLNWQSAPGVRFRVERSTNLSGTWNDLGIMEGGTFTDANPPAGKAFYRIRLLRP
jgi:hypothetical protein